jgi:ATP synthase protein I
VGEPPEFEKQVAAQERRKLQAQHTPPRVLSGLAYVGLVGWAVALPTLLGVLLGQFLDSHYPSKRSWTLVLLLAGLCVGCVSAWRRLAGQNHTEDK